MPTDPDSPQLVKAAALQRVRSLTYLLDNAIGIPGTRLRFGLDPILGLIPGGGDTLGAVLSAYIVLEAMRFRLPRETLVRMVSNLLLDALLGLLPFLGDLFDVTWKANSRNLELLETHAANPDQGQAADRGFVVLMVAVVIVIVVGITALVAFVVSSVLHAIAVR